MSAIIRKLIGRNLVNVMIIGLVFLFYLGANWLQLPIILQIVLVAGSLLTLLKVR